MDVIPGGSSLASSFQRFQCLQPLPWVGVPCAVYKCHRVQSLHHGKLNVGSLGLRTALRKAAGKALLAAGAAGSYRGDGLLQQIIGLYRNPIVEGTLSAIPTWFDEFVKRKSDSTRRPSINKSSSIVTGLLHLKVVQSSNQFKMCCPSQHHHP